MTTQNDANKSKNNYQSESQQAFWQAQIKTVNENNPFMRHNGIYATYLDADRAEVRAQAGDTGRNAMGSVPWRADVYHGRDGGRAACERQRTQIRDAGHPASVTCAPAWGRKSWWQKHLLLKEEKAS